MSVGFRTVVWNPIEMCIRHRWIWIAGVAFFGALPVLSQKNLNSNSEQAMADLSNRPVQTTGPQRSLPGVVEAEKTGDWLMAQHRYQAALEAYQNVLTPSAKLWSRIGIAYQSLLDPPDAVRCYKKSLKLEPDNARVLNDLATAYDQLDEHRQAERLYRKAIRLDSNSATYFKNLGTNLLAQNKYKQGSQAYSQALMLDPRIFDNRSNPLMVLPASLNAETNYARARSCALAGQKECALVYLTKALNEGSATPQRVDSDRQFNTIRNDPSLQELLAKSHN